MPLEGHNPQGIHSEETHRETLYCVVRAARAARVVRTTCPDGVNQVKEGARRGDGDDPDDDEDRAEVAQVGDRSRVLCFQ